MRTTRLMDRIKIIGILGLTLMVSTSLIGCASMIKRLGYQPIPVHKSKTCQTSTVLITNLKANKNNRDYVLPSGQACVFQVKANKRLNRA